MRKGMKALVLAAYDDSPEANSVEIADRLGVDPGYVRATIARAGLSFRERARKRKAMRASAVEGAQ